MKCKVVLAINAVILTTVLAVAAPALAQHDSAEPQGLSVVGSTAYNLGHSSIIAESSAPLDHGELASYRAGSPTVTRVTGKEPSTEVRIFADRSTLIRLQDFEMLVRRMPGGRVLIRRKSGDGLIWSTVLDLADQLALYADAGSLRKSVLSSTVTSARSGCYEVGASNSISLSSSLGLTGSATTNKSRESYLQTTGDECLDRSNDPVCSDCSLSDSVTLYGSSVLSGVICAGSSGAACGAALVAFLGALDNFNDDCGECNEKYPYFSQSTDCSGNDTQVDSGSAMYAAYVTWWQPNYPYWNSTSFGSLQSTFTFAPYIVNVTPQL